jgi:hypothetical protein
MMDAFNTGEGYILMMVSVKREEPMTRDPEEGDGMRGGGSRGVEVWE